jgi:hypothetical protein
MFWFYRRRVTGQLQTGEFLMNGEIGSGRQCFAPPFRINLRVGVRRDIGLEEKSAGLHSETRPASIPCALLPDRTISVDAATLKEAMLNHAVAKHQEEDCQKDREQ